jgi:hypothetical protein
LQTIRKAKPFHKEILLQQVLEKKLEVHNLFRLRCRGKIIAFLYATAQQERQPHRQIPSKPVDTFMGEK